MKTIMLHHINIGVNRDMANFRGNFNLEEPDNFGALNFNLADADITLTGKDVFNSKELICEKNNFKNKSFESITRQYLEDFKSQAPDNFDLHYHIVIPNLEMYTRGIEMIPPSYGKGKGLLQLRLFPFCFQNDWSKFRNLFRKLILSINGKEFENEYEFIIFENYEPYSDVNIIPKFNYDDEYVGADYAELTNKNSTHNG
jgi:hypothetical protein